MIQQINLKATNSQQFIDILGDQMIKIEDEEEKVEEVKKRLDEAEKQLDEAEDEEAEN